MTELKGHEEPAQRAPAQGCRARREPGSADLAGASARPRPKSSVTPPSRTWSSSAAVRAASRSARGSGSSACRRSSSTATRGPATPGATATSRSACTTRSGTTTCPYIDFPKNWPVFSPKDKIGDWLEMYAEGHGAQLLGQSTECKSATYDETARSGPSSSSATASEITLRPKQLVLATGHVRQGQRAALRRDGRLQRRPAPLVAAPRTGCLPRQAGGRHRLQQFRARHLRGAVGGRRRRDDGAAVVDAHRAGPTR